MNLNLSFFFDPFTKMTKDQIIRMQDRINKGEVNSKTGKPFEFPSHVHITHGARTNQNDFGNYCTLTNINFGQNRIVKYEGGTLVLNNVEIPGKKGELRHLSDAKKTPTTDAPSFSAINCAFQKLITKTQSVTINSSDVPEVDSQRATSVKLTNSTTTQAITGKNLETLHIDECSNFILTTEQVWQVRESNEGKTSKKIDFKHSIQENDMTSTRAASNKTLFNAPQP